MEVKKYSRGPDDNVVRVHLHHHEFIERERILGLCRSSTEVISFGVRGRVPQPISRSRSKKKPEIIGILQRSIKSCYANTDNTLLTSAAHHCWRQTGWRKLAKRTLMNPHRQHDPQGRPQTVKKLLFYVDERGLGGASAEILFWRGLGKRCAISVPQQRCSLRC